MKTRHIFGDRTMRALLEGYSRPDADGSKFNSMFEAAARGANIVTIPRRAARMAFGWVAAAAAILVLFLGAGILLRGRAYIDGPIEAYRVEPDGTATALSLARQGELPAAPGIEIRLRTKSETIAASEGARLALSQDALRFFSGKKGRTYRIDVGGLVLVHFDPALPFTVRTPFGEIRPLGTSLCLRVDDTSLDLACTAGSIVFTPKDGGAGIVIESGRRMLYTEGESIHTLRDMNHGEILPFAPAFPEIKEIPTGAQKEWLDPAPKAGSDTEDGAPAQETTLDPDKGDAGEKKNPELKRIWSIDSGSNEAERLGKAGTSLVILKESKLSAWDADTGKRLFSIALASRPDGFAVDADAYLLFGKSLACVDGKTGGETWRVETGPISFSDIAAANGIVAVASADGYLYVVDAASGRLLSKQAAGVGMYGVPAIAKDRIVASALDARLRGFDPEGASPAWSYEIGERLTGDRPIMLNGLFLLDADPKGGFFVLDAKNGSPLGKAKFAPPLKRWPISLGKYAAFQDSEGIKGISSAGAVSATINPATGDLIAATTSRLGSLLATREGIWLANMDEGRAERLAKTEISLAAMETRRAFVMSPSGRLSLWELADD